MLHDINEEYGFLKLRMKINETINIKTNNIETHIQLWQIYDDDISYYYLGKVKILKKYINIYEILESLNKNYNVTTKRIYEKYVDIPIEYKEILVLDKPQEALDWIISIATIHQLANS